MRQQQYLRQQPFANKRASVPPCATSISLLSLDARELKFCMTDVWMDDMTLHHRSPYTLRLHASVW